MELLTQTNILWTGVAVLVLIILPSIRVIGPTEVGLVIKRFSVRKLSDDNPIAFRGEAMSDEITGAAKRRRRGHALAAHGSASGGVHAT